MAGHFPQVLDLFQGLKIGVPGGCLEKTSNFKTIIIYNVTLWSKLEPSARTVGEKVDLLEPGGRGVI